MAHYALIDQQTMIVAEVFVGREETDFVDGIDDWETYYSLEGFFCRRTSYNTRGGVHINGGTPFRKNYAGIGYIYDELRDAFIPPQPFASWTLNEDSCLWEPPVPHPADGQMYEWDESSLNWVILNAPV